MYESRKEKKKKVDKTRKREQQRKWEEIDMYELGYVILYVG